MRNILTEESADRETPFRIQATAVKALHVASEAYLTTLMEDANLCTLHARRVTLQPKDIHLVQKLRGDLG